MKKSLIYLFAVILAISLTSCVDNTPADAERVTKQDLLDGKITGFQWFEDVYNEYNSTTNIDAIQQALTDEYSFVLIGKPSCSCDNWDAESFAEVVKILDMAGAESHYELLMANSYRSAHPYEDKFTIKVLPAYFIMKNGEAVYSIFDELLSDTTQRSIEKYILDGLSK